MCQQRGPKSGADGSCTYTRRVQFNGEWCCPDGTADTGYDWNDGSGNEDKQCAALPCGTMSAGPPKTAPPPLMPPQAPPPPVAPSFCQSRGGRKRVPDTCATTGRVQFKGQWCCPANTVDTGHDWGDGSGQEAKQCVALGCAGYSKYNISTEKKPRATAKKPRAKPNKKTTKRTPATVSTPPPTTVPALALLPMVGVATHTKTVCTTKLRKRCKKEEWRAGEMCQMCKKCVYGPKDMCAMPGWGPSASANPSRACRNCAFLTEPPAVLTA